MYMFVKMSSKWFCVEFNIDREADRENMMLHIENDNLVAFANDIECFAEEMEIEVDDIEMA